MQSEVKQWIIGWDHTKESFGLWPMKTMVSLWFVHCTNKLMMIEIRKMMKGEVEDKNFEVNGEAMRGNLEVREKKEVSPQKKPLSRAQAMFYRAPKGANGDK